VNGANLATYQTLVTMQVGGQPFGIAVETVRDVLPGQRISAIPLAPRAIAGSLNLRGRIVTVLDVRIILGLEAAGAPQGAMNVVIEQDGEFYSLLVDQVGDVITVKKHEIEVVPQTVIPKWKSVSLGIIKMKSELVIILSTEILLQMVRLGIVDELAA
jgi:purine-binding chemotaxis protein CheW